MSRTLQYYIDKESISNGDVRYFPKELIEELNSRSNPCTGSIRERLEWIKAGRENYPECAECGNLLTSKHWDTRFSKYGTFCTKSCSAKARQKSDSYKNNNIEKFGTAHPLSSKKIQEKRIATNLQRYGRSHPHPWSSKEFESFIEEKHGVNKVRHIPGADEKIQSKILEKTKDAFPEKIKKVESLRDVKCITEDFLWVGTRFDEQLLKWRHLCGTEFESTIFYNTDGINIKSCPKCSHGTSKLEQDIFEFVKKHAPDAINRVRDIIPPLEIDIFVPSLNLAIEVDGTYWHSAKFVDKSKAQRKLMMCREIGIKLITITEFDYLGKEVLVKSRLLSALNKVGRRIPARKCSVVHLNTELKNFFFNQNHIDGDARSSVAYALVYKDQVVMTMSFGKSRFSKKHEWEIIRSASATNTSVIGGVSKLISHFKKTHNPKSLITYADLNWGDGSSYMKAGLTFSHITAPGYVYVSKAGQVISRYQAQKKKLPELLGLENYSPFLTELQNMQNNGYIQVFNRGNAVFELK